MTNNTKRIAGVIVIVIIIAVAAFAIFHKSSNNSTSANNSTAATSHNASKPAVSNSIVLTKTSPTLGQYLTNPSGRALYTYNADSSGVSNCTGSCLAAWPAYVATSTAANLPSGISTFKRSDNGAMQYAYNGMPLYYFASDSGNQVTGNGIENFQVAKPAAAQQSSSPQTQSQQPTTSNNSSSSPY